ncbi:MAG: tRNA 2-thiouridine(34) synthase MnmA [Endomicrobium sp.]|jgi:tRNA-specific 2-thiouridylase|nr:tRNA 2-thiouridine(34) synthase MnmA [Endomicrobium sp.]
MKILIGLSGGVDSAVAAYLLKKQGYTVIGAMMSIWNSKIKCNSNYLSNTCFGPEDNDIKIVKNISKFLGIQIHIIDCKKEYSKIVIANFKNEYKNGRTPNPCILCNTYIKFNILPKIAKEKLKINFDKFATGHYANIKFNSKLNMYQLYNAFDYKKDQTYFLYRLKQSILSKTLFPIGIYTKNQVRDIAKNIKMPIADKPDSQDFYCGNYNDILQFRDIIGNILNVKGEIIGKHNGIWKYTIGQRKHLGLLGGTKKPLYVIKIKAKENIIVVGTKENLYSSYFIVKKVTWNSIPIPVKSIKAYVKVRQNNKPIKATIIPLNSKTAKIVLAKPQISITKGQSAVFYKDKIVLGGGIIDSNYKI